MFTLTDKMKADLTAGYGSFDWQALLAKLADMGPMFIQLLLILLGKAPLPTPAPALRDLADACPCPDPTDGHGCCHASQHHILLAALCCEGHCCKGGSCDTRCCCRETLHHLLKAVQCCTGHLCC